MARKKILVTAACVLSLGGAVALASTNHVIGQAGKKFSEEVLNVSVGDSVVFRNDDGVKHNIIVAKMRFNSGMQDPGTDAELTIEKAGTFKVRCGLHPKMKLTIKAQ